MSCKTKSSRRDICVEKRGMQKAKTGFNTNAGLVFRFLKGIYNKWDEV